MSEMFERRLSRDEGAGMGSLGGRLVDSSFIFPSDAVQGNLKWDF